MHRPLPVLLLLGILFAAVLVGCSRKSAEGDNVRNIDKDDPDMKAAIATARASLPEFWQTFEKRGGGETDFALKVRIADKDETEYFWLIDLERRDGRIYGTINNEPEVVRSVKLGERMQIREADISDWLYMRGGKMAGNYTLRAMFKTMTPAEVAQCKKRLAEP